MTHSDEPITLKVILDHMHAIKYELKHDIQTLRIELTDKINGVGARVDRLENRLERVALNLSAQIAAIDDRLDKVEIEDLPKRVRKLEKAVFK